MSTLREPILTPVSIADLRPTQITVGMREVQVRRAYWHAKRKDKAEKFLGRHMIPIVLGPERRPHVIDHHHLARALLEEGVKDVLVTVIANLSELDMDTFWFVLDNRGWMHPFNANGRRCDRRDIPKSIGKLVDDPFRSLAGALRRAGGFSKDTTPFSEFLWADFLRKRVKRNLVEEDFEKALKKGCLLAKEPQASYLPGWCGPSTED